MLSCIAGFLLKVGLGRYITLIAFASTWQKSSASLGVVIKLFIKALLVLCH